MFSSRRSAVAGTALSLVILIAGVAGGYYLWPSSHASATNRSVATATTKIAQPGYGTLPPQTHFVTADQRCHANVVVWKEFVYEDLPPGQLNVYHGPALDTLVAHHAADGLIGPSGKASAYVRYGTILLPKLRQLWWNVGGSSGALSNVVVTVIIGNHAAWKYSASPTTDHVTIPDRGWLNFQIRLTATAASWAAPHTDPMPYEVPGCHGSGL